MDYFKDEEYYLDAENGIFVEVDNKDTDKTFAQKMMSNYDVTISDKELYRDFDKLLVAPTPSKLIINFSDSPINKDLLARLVEIKTLRHLELSFLHSNISKIPNEVFTLTNLQSLHISNIETTELQSAIGNMKNLQKLTVIQTHIETLPDTIFDLTELKILELEINHLNKLSEDIHKLHNLKELCLLDNNLTTLPKSIYNLKNLKELNISYNTVDLITDDVVKSLKNEIPQLDLTTIKENSPEYIEMTKLIFIHNKVSSFYKTLDTSKLIYNSFEELQYTCEQLIEKEYGRDDDFFEYVRSLREMLIPIQPWSESM